MPRGGSLPAHAPQASDFARLAEYPFIVVSWVDDTGYPTSVATAFRVDPERGLVHLAAPAGAAVAIPTDRELSLIGSHIRPRPGEGYDERRYLELWGSAETAVSGRVTFRPRRAWGWDEREVPFFEYAERSVPQSRHYLASLSAERGRVIRPRLSPFWLAFRTTRLPFLSATVVPVLMGVAIAASHGSFTWWTALLTVIGASFAHLGANVANDVFDTRSGADAANVNPTQYSGGSRVALYDLLTVGQLAVLSVGLYAVAAAIGLLLVWVTGSLMLLWIGLAGFVIGIGYTAPPLRLVYRGFGEIAIAIAFGPLLVLGAYVVQTGRLGWEPALVAVPLGILVALILYVNEVPDRVGDASMGKRTLPTRLKPDAVRRGYLAAAGVAFVLIAFGVAAGLLPWPTIIAMAALPIVWRVHQGMRVSYDQPYALMAVMGTNIKLHLAVGGLLLAAYLVTIFAALLG